MLQKVDATDAQPYEAGLDEAQAGEGDEKPGRGRGVFLWLTRGFFQALLMIAILAGAGFVANRMVESKPEPRKRPAFKTVYTVDTVIASAADNQPTITAYGTTAALRSVDLRALVSGEVVSVNDDLLPGARVEEGEALLEIDDFNYQGALQEARANQVEAEARITENRARIALEKSKLSSLEEQLDFARADLQRAGTLRQRGQLTQQQLESRQLVVSQREQALEQSRNTIKVEEAKIEQLMASIDRLRWRVEQAERNVASTILKAPFDGVVRSRAVEVGRVVNANDVVVSMYQGDAFEVRFTLTDAQYGRLQTVRDGLIGRPVDITWTVGGRNWNWPGRIERVGAEITSSRGGVELFARVLDAKNDVDLRPGAFVEVTVPDATVPQSFSIPDTALYGANSVYVVVDGKLQQRKVDVAAFDIDRVIIRDGLASGDEVLVTRITEVSEGLSVRTEEQAASRGAD